MVLLRRLFLVGMMFGTVAAEVSHTVLLISRMVNWCIGVDLGLILRIGLWQMFLWVMKESDH